MSSYAGVKREFDTDADPFDDDDGAVYVPLKQRRLQQHRHIQQLTKHADGENESQSPSRPRSLPPPAAVESRTLVDIALHALPNDSAADADAAEEALLARNLATDRAPLLGLKEAAHGRTSDSEPPLDTRWRPPRAVLAMTDAAKARRREKFSIAVDGEDIAASLASFRAMKLPSPILAALRLKGIERPTPIQMQALPVVLSGRDVCGIAFTGSGKTLVFALPAIMAALHAEMALPLRRGEGPIALVLCPSRELARQHCEVIDHFIGQLTLAGYATLRTMLAIGGVPIVEQLQQLSEPRHIIVATPGRLLDLLTKQRVRLNLCSFLALDESDRLIDLGFEADIRAIFDHFSHRRQTVLFSATMPKQIQEFALSALHRPVLINVGRAGATAQSIVQEVEYVKSEARLPYLLECLQKTPPPALVFASHSADVDAIHEFLLTHRVNAAAMHGAMAQADRARAIQQFTSGAKDVLVATDVASKGLDFPAIHHVVNYDLPKDIEDYVHRIGRTGRRGQTGVATTFIHRDTPMISMQDLKALLVEAKQKLPPMLAMLPDRVTAPSSLREAGCSYCGGLGHGVLECPKLAAVNRAKQNSTYAYDFIEQE